MADAARYKKHLVVPLEYAGRRLDVALTALCCDISRSLIHKWIQDQTIWVNNKSVKASYRLKGAEEISIDGQMPLALDWDTQDEVEFQVIYADDHIVVVDKPAGIVVHPGTGNTRGTLVNGLLAEYPELTKLPRAGIVHRLDKDTSGVLVVARSELAVRKLVEAISTRTISREYRAILEGTLDLPRFVDLPIGRHPSNRTKQQVNRSGRPAQTDFEPLEIYRRHTLVRAKLHTGRTHQIRVHASALGHPLLGDQTYGARSLLPKHADEETRTLLRNFGRQALHARKLTLSHPHTDKRMAFVSAIPDDFARMVEVLRRDFETYSAR